MKRLFILLTAVALLGSGSATRLAAHEGHDHKVLGTVTMAAADHVMLKDRDGKEVLVKVTRNTTVKARTAMKVEQIQAGTRVVITATEAKDKSLTAKSIEVGVVAAADGKSR